MELAAQIKRRRTELGLSQEALAEKIYVSRQTISNWETDRTYPDVQSLLLLSVLFDTTVDELIKGDVETMEARTNEDARHMLTLGWIMALFLVAMVVVLIGGTVTWGWDLVPTLVAAFGLWGVAMLAACEAERIKRKNDLVTYQEILAYANGKRVERDTEKGRRARARMASPWHWLRTAGMVALAAAAGALVGYFGAALVDLLR